MAASRFMSRAAPGSGSQLKSARLERARSRRCGVLHRARAAVVLARDRAPMLVSAPRSAGGIGASRPLTLANGLTSMATRAAPPFAS